MPNRAQVRQACDVRRDPLSKRDLRDLQGEEGMRPVPQGQVLPDGHQVGAMPCRVLLRRRGSCAGPVPRQLFLPAGIISGHCLSEGKEGGLWVQVQP